MRPLRTLIIRRIPSFFPFVSRHRRRDDTNYLSIIVSITRLVIIAKGSHPFPFRTRKLSPSAPMVLPYGGRVGRRQTFFYAQTTEWV